jgi:cell wall-associated NlpC family hydrolase
MEKVSLENWLKQLRSYLGTRFRHQGRATAGGGIDCIGLVIKAAHDLGIDHGTINYRAYAHTPDPGTLEKECNAYMNRVPYNRLQPLRRQVKIGSVLLMWVEQQGTPRHVGVYTGVDRHGRDTIIHSYAQENRGVIEQPMGAYWVQRVCAVYELKDVEYGAL